MKAALVFGALLSLPIVVPALVTIYRAWVCRRRGHQWDPTGLQFICFRCGHRAP